MTVVEERKRHCELHRVPVVTVDDYHRHAWTAHAGNNFACCWLVPDPDPTWNVRKWNP
jgi:hypothetical protein